jgi:hypothetical protein
MLKKMMSPYFEGKKSLKSEDEKKEGYAAA